jgi:hypothetical protein
MRAHFDQMQDDVASKVDEAMASFRDERIRISPRVTSPSPEPSPAPPADPYKGRVFRLAWIAATLALILLGWQSWLHLLEPAPSEMVADAPHKTAPAPRKAAPAPTVPPSPVPVSSPLEPIADPVALIEPSPTARPLAGDKPAKQKNRQQIKKEKPTRYSEDLTDLLQRK